MDWNVTQSRKGLAVNRKNDKIGREGFPTATMEPLEPRLLLSGFVSAAIVVGNLVITGDGAANSVEVAAMAGDGKYVITPRDGTFVNKSPDPVTVNGKVADVKIKMNAGDDAVTVTGDVARDLVIDGGEGNNTIDVFGATVGRDLSVQGGSGYEDIRALFVTSGRDVSINSGSGPAFIVVDLATIGRDLSISGNRGLHNVVLYNPSVGRDLRMMFGIGQDTIAINQPGVVLGASGAAVASGGYDSIGRNLFISTGDDGDSVYVGWLAIAGNAWLDTGSGNDAIAVTASTIQGSTALLTGSGDDMVSMGVPGPSLKTDTFFLPYTLVAGTQFNGRVTVDTGFGNDVITAGTFWEPCPPVAFNGSAIITGGTGTDRFVQGPNVSGRINLREIEPANKPDLLLSDLQVLSWSSSSVDFRYKVSNIGDKPANLDGPTSGMSDNVRVPVWLDDLGSGSSAWVKTITLSGQLGPGQSLLAVDSISVAADPNKLLRLVIDGGGLLEMNYLNNTGATLLWSFLL